MPEHEGVGPDLDLFDDQPQDALAIGDPQGLRGLVELGEKAFEALGERDVRLGVRSSASRAAS